MGFGAHLIPFENMSDRFEYPHISIGAGGRDFVIDSILAALPLRISCLWLNENIS